MWLNVKVRKYVKVKKKKFHIKTLMTRTAINILNYKMKTPVFDIFSFS